MCTVYLVNVGKYTILMDAMGYIYRDSARFTRSLLQTPSCPVAQLFEGPDPEILSRKMMLKNNPPNKNCPPTIRVPWRNGVPKTTPRVRKC